MPFEQTPQGACVPFAHGSQQSKVSAQPDVKSGMHAAFSQ
jgi:hypothetical protein